MGTKTIKTCDAFGSAKNVSSYKIIVSRIPKPGETLFEGAEPEAQVFDADFSLPGYRRFMKFLKRGLGPTRKPATKERK